MLDGELTDSRGFPCLRQAGSLGEYAMQDKNVLPIFLTFNWRIGNSSYKSLIHYQGGAK
jgi:hypothetical protein